MTTAPWLSLIGIGEDGELSSAARALIDAAASIFGGARHLDLAGPTKGEKVKWPSPFSIDGLLARRGRPTAVLASGDPFFYGVGASIAALVPPEEIFCLPAPSAFSLAAARLCWSQQDCALLSLHGRALERIAPHLQPGRRLIALSWDETTPGRVAELLSSLGFGRSIIHVLENLGGPRERVRAAQAEGFSLQDTGPLNTIGIELVAAPGARAIALTPGLPDDWFEHDGQITKRDIRAVTLSALAPRKGEILWDIGAGSGSIGIEWLLADPANRAVALEQDPERAARAARNAANLGVPDLQVITARAPEGLVGLPPPDAIFIGGGASAPVIEAAWSALPRYGRIVVNAVTLETQALLTQAFRDHGGELVHVQIAKARPVGRFTALDPAMPVLQWRAAKT
ncbi:precorrin-6y C5,15-methyltransferase (decarboxylating) subunit CbiE [Methylocystis heyeri]|uniref:precorrin-6y C5,15-methyltransferase (decarboxylating) subunit CbiE n=1 Tax=Methylocystis heyeri TaxID=391905 RepID=UPI0011339035|nr:precorrin-6y C5,15-methyltransferase (decarboxylating) subunit CbiE [Methylocystis heyeri]